ncbi:MAG: Elongation factor Ts [Chlamydiae bacterium]|nr:Elongation factor Ts [Chlamydiota bacterium]
MITAQKVKELRERTGVGMAKCKEALQGANGDIELAIDNLRKAGMASAVKKEGRTANEGLIGFAENDSHISLVEINSETDFVAKNDKFKDFLKTVAEEVIASKPKDIESFLSQKYSKDPELTVDEFRATMIQLLGENIIIKRFELIEKKSDHSYGAYAHMQGKIMTFVELSKSGCDAAARDIAMHVAAEAPEFLNPESVPADIIEHEKEIAKSQIKGKPENIIEKILTGKVQAFFDQVCLTKQKFVKDSKLSVEAFAASQCDGLKVVHFIRWQVGN